MSRTPALPLTAALTSALIALVAPMAQAEMIGGRVGLEYSAFTDDTDYAKASSELARTQIISQAATSVLAQANQSQQSVMKLLQG